MVVSQTYSNIIYIQNRKIEKLIIEPERSTVIVCIMYTIKQQWAQNNFIKTERGKDKGH